jgi:hypothetical protein
MSTEFEKAKKAYANYLISKLPGYDTLTPAQKNVLGNGRGYSPEVIEATGRITEQCDNRESFDTKAGLYAKARKTQYSEVLWWHYKNNVTVSLTDWVRELRWLYYRCRDIMRAEQTNAVSLQ